MYGKKSYTEDKKYTPSFSFLLPPSTTLLLRPIYLSRPFISFFLSRSYFLLLSLSSFSFPFFPLPCLTLTPTISIFFFCKFLSLSISLSLLSKYAVKAQPFLLVCTSLTFVIRSKSTHKDFQLPKSRYVVDQRLRYALTELIAPEPRSCQTPVINTPQDTSLLVDVKLRAFRLLGTTQKE